MAARDRRRLWKGPEEKEKQPGIKSRPGPENRPVPGSCRSEAKTDGISAERVVQISRARKYQRSRPLDMESIYWDGLPGGVQDGRPADGSTPPGTSPTRRSVPAHGLIQLLDEAPANY